MPSRYVIVESGVVVNAVLAEADWIAEHHPGAIESATAAVGDTWNGSAFVRPTPAVVVPAEVTMAQARIALSRAGVTQAAVDDVIAALPAGATRTEAAIWWDKSNTVRRNSGNVATLAPALGLDAAALDALFIAAAAIQP